MGLGSGSRHRWCVELARSGVLQPKGINSSDRGIRMGGSLEQAQDRIGRGG